MIALFLRGPLLHHQQGLLAAASALIVFGAIGLEQQGKIVRSKLVLQQGAASYSIYLLHPLVLQFTGKAMILTGLNATIPGTLLGYAATLFIVGAVAKAVDTYIERPIQEALKPSPTSRPSATT
jgi:peptidoglycan/LPS O-acetylase OafA/YrhL